MVNEICDSCQEKKDKESRQRRIREKIESEIPKKYQEIESDHNEIFNDLQEISIFLTGGSGTGKTVFACSLAKKYLRKGYNIKFISFPSFIMELQSSFKKDRPKDMIYGESSQNSFEIAEDVAKFSGILVIDDLGAEKLTEFVRQIIYFIINEREQQCLTTIITSNFSLSELDEHIDSRISSRISGMCKVIKLTGKDRRLDK
jgi:DNA replication protein DnaC